MYPSGFLRSLFTVGALAAAAGTWEATAKGEGGTVLAAETSTRAEVGFISSIGSALIFLAIRVFRASRRVKVVVVAGAERGASTGEWGGKE